MLQPIQLNKEHSILTAILPRALAFAGDSFEDLWSLKPDEYNEIHLHGRMVALPRWQRAYGRDYRFSGQVTKADPVPELLGPHVEWAQGHVDERLNGLLVNWYDGRLGHYIGAHRDERRWLYPGSSIVTLSFGEERVLRFRKLRTPGFHDVAAPNGTVIVIPWETNLEWTHEVPKTKRAVDRRVSITLRAFEG